MKIPFTLEAWLKDKSQKVQTRDGRLVHNIWRVKEPSYTNNKKAEVCALIDGEEDALVFFEGGRYLPTTQDTDSPFDLFLVTPEPELSDWEKFISGCLQKHGLLDCGAADRIAQNCSAELLELAIEQVGHKWVIRQESYQDGYINGLHDGKAEALKDLPRWKNNWDNLRSYKDISGLQHIVLNGKAMNVSDLEKLPGFKED